MTPRSPGNACEVVACQHRAKRTVPFQRHSKDTSREYFTRRAAHIACAGAAIQVEKDIKGKIAKAICYTRDGWALADCTLGVFKRLKTRGLIASQDSRPYRITREGLMAVRPQLDNR